MGAKYTKGQAEATKRYLEDFENIVVRVPIGDKEKYKNAAASRGKSLNRFIIDCMEKEL